MGLGWGGRQGDPRIVVRQTATEVGAVQDAQNVQYRRDENDKGEDAFGSL